MFGRFPRTLLKSVEHVDDFHELGYVQHPVLQRCVNADLPDARPNDGHRLPVERVQPLLDTSKLKACESPGVSRESPKVVPRGSKPQERLVSHG